MADGAEQQCGTRSGTCAQQEGIQQCVADGAEQQCGTRGGTCAQQAGIQQCVADGAEQQYGTRSGTCAQQAGIQQCVADGAEQQCGTRSGTCAQQAPGLTGPRRAGNKRGVNAARELMHASQVDARNLSLQHSRYARERAHTRT